LIAQQSDPTSESAANADQREVPVNKGKSVGTSDSNLTSGEGHNEQQHTEDPTQKPPKPLTVLVNGKAKEATATLFVGNLTRTTEEQTLEHVFAEYGELRGVRIITSGGRSRGFGYVEFVSAENAANDLQARDGLELDGRGLRLEFSTPLFGTANVLNHDQQRREAQGRPIINHDHSIDAANGDTNDASTNQSGQDEVHTTDYDTSYSEETDDMDDARIRVLIKLYVLADKLLDPHTANLVIDELIAFADALGSLPQPYSTKIVYERTPTGSPLALFCDWYIHEGYYTWDDQTDFGLPVEFLQDLLIATGRIQTEHRNEIIDEVFRTKAINRPAGHYHQKSGGSPSDDRA
jgi:hypothetical protein